MSVEADRPAGPDFEPEASPEFALDYMIDDKEAPSELTIFSPREPDITTHWITVDFDSAVPIQDVR